MRASSRTTPLEKFRSLHEEVADWLRQTVPGMPEEAVVPVLTDMELAVRLAQEAAGLQHLGAWTGAHVEGVLVAAATVQKRLHEQAGPEGVDPSVADFGNRVAAALSPLTVFLMSTGRWTGTRDDFIEVRAILDQVSPTSVDARALTEVLDRPEDREATAAALAQTPLGQHLVSLLRWHSPHRDIDQNGLLLPTDVAAAAVAVGLEPTGPLESIRDAPRLLHLLAGLEAAELLDRSSGRAVPVVSADALASETPLNAEQLVVAAAGALKLLLEEASDADNDDEVGPPRTSALMLAALPLLSTAAIGGEVTAEMLRQSDQMAGSSILIAELRDLGVLRDGSQPGGLVVTPGLEHLLARPTLQLLEEATGEETWDDEDWDDDED
ncbi:hypothetical protein SAMN06264364_10419 [Quadrisphaera granulorum]|uniref:Uncharacterized protein n=1 Tax=Quadrisphaera granulorum TaxID=317664 RepID=A0A316ACX3_9ACTN|nr:hypothetical protein [Quadrisphaera granulorum]PWJ55098.1 hypothetical protein BXY45_10419 [Quadrisphaera granulorum]SZE95607.1 hypothetical protein SAMN06264364_10419 [Quadrisphaera granulorum]